MTKKYLKRLKKMPQDFQYLFIDTIDKIEKWNLSDLDITSLTWKKNWYRCRLGKFRIVFYKNDIDDYIIEEIGSRWDIYK